MVCYHSQNKGEFFSSMKGEKTQADLFRIDKNKYSLSTQKY